MNKLPETLVFDREIAVEAFKSHFKVSYLGREVMGALSAFFQNSIVAFLSDIVGFVAASNGGHPHEGFTTGVREAAINGFGLHHGELEIFLLQRKPEHHLDILFVFRMLLHPLN